MYREVDAAFWPVSATGWRLRLVSVVGELAILAAEDKPASTPCPDAPTHLDKKAGSSVSRDRNVGSKPVDAVSRLLDETEQVKRLTTDW